MTLHARIARVLPESQVSVSASILDAHSRDLGLGSAPPRALSRSCKGTGEAARSTDVCVPTGELTGAVAHARGRVDALALEAAIVAHAGDGNYHVLLMFDPADDGEARWDLHRGAWDRPRQDRPPGAGARRPAAAPPLV